jgi:hypothetical protein
MAKNQSLQQTVDLIHAADMVCIRGGWGIGSDGPNYRPDPAAIARLGMTAELEEEMAILVEEGLTELKDMFLFGTETAVTQ